MSYNRGEIHHVGTLPALEDEWTTWVPDGSSWSPGRIDATVWAVLEDMEAQGGGAYA
jgi:phage terminase large subunit-like protein